MASTHPGSMTTMVILMVIGMMMSKNFSLPSKILQGSLRLWPTSWMSSEADISPSTPLRHGSNLDNIDSSAVLTDRASVVSTPRPATNTVPIAVSATTDANPPGGKSSLTAPNDNPAKGETSAEPDAQVNTDLVFLEGSVKLMLTHQRPIICAIIQDSIDHL
ncbi:hypothetical protein EI94DRAFT_1805783 [Lactarius quietus]|nr:hypothetical protein EI94DRAFT_1805783 [Lactarius quietus]